MKKYEYKRSKINIRFYADNFINLYNRAKHSEQKTFIWLLNVNIGNLYYLKNGDGDYIAHYNSQHQIDLLLDRPVIYDESVPVDTIIFREYKS